MSRVIKFRYWDGKKYLPKIQMPWLNHDGTTWSPSCCHWGADEEPWEGLTTEQFTGLLDGNGREIYEGDVVRWTHPITDIGVVEYVIDGSPNVQQCFWGVNVARLGGVCAFQSDDEYEVIGDIHQNPELLQLTKT